MSRFSWSIPPTVGRREGLRAWSGGYTTDVVYDDQIVRELCPAWFSMVSVFGVQPPLDLTRRQVWLDLACGTGLMACAVAAGHPNIEVWGVDFNPAHIERAQGLARTAALKNVTFVEGDFATVAQDRSIGPDEVDIVVVNGVYSWVSADNQDRIVEIISQRLRPGGLAHVMYETAAGWSSMGPVAEALRLMVDADGRRGDLAFHDAAAAMVDFASDGAAYFPMGSRETAQMQGWADLNTGLGAHEYLGAHFAPLDVSDVHGVMAKAKCSFIGGVNPLDRHAHYSYPPGFRDVLSFTNDSIKREMIRDLSLQTPLRSDLFRRGKATLTPSEHEEALRNLRIGGLGKPFESVPIDLPAMNITLDPTYHEPLIDSLNHGILDVVAMLEIHPSWSLSDATTAMALLSAAGYAAPTVLPEPVAGSVDACWRLNRALSRERSFGREHACIATPATGTMVALDFVEALGMDALWVGIQPNVQVVCKHVADTLASLQMTVREDGMLVQDAGEAKRIVLDRIAQLLGRQPAFDSLGVV